MEALRYMCCFAFAKDSIRVTVVQDQHAEEPVAMVSIQKSIVIAVGFLAAMAGTGWAGSEAEYAIGSDDVERISGVAQAAATTALSLSRNEMVAKLPQSRGGSAEVRRHREHVADDPAGFHWFGRCREHVAGGPAGFHRFGWCRDRVAHDPASLHRFGRR